MIDERTVLSCVMAVIFLCGIIGFWGNCLGHNPNMPYASRAPFLKFFGYPLWNAIAFFSFGRMRTKSWREEHNEYLRKNGLDRYVW